VRRDIGIEVRPAVPALVGGSLDQFGAGRATLHFIAHGVFPFDRMGQRLMVTPSKQVENAHGSELSGCRGDARVGFKRIAL
jgi:hypothetical protein